VCVVFWNKLPQVVVDQISLASFKTALYALHIGNQMFFLSF